MKENLHTLFPLYEGEKEIKMKKNLSFLIAVCLMITGIPVTTFAQSSSREQVCMVISSKEDFQLFLNSIGNGNTYKDKIIKLSQDIKFDGVSVNNFSGSSGDFEGTFDGAGYSITGIDQTGISGAGLFDSIGYSGVVRNLTVEGNFNGISGGGVIAYENNGLIDNCLVKGDIDGENIGGIVYRNYGTILNCGSDMYMHQESHDIEDCIGGVTARNYGNIFNSYNISTVINDGKYYGQSMEGGITAYSSGIIQNCYNTGWILDSGYRKCGEIVGYMEEGIISNCSYVGEQEVVKKQKGGVIKQNYAYYEYIYEDEYRDPMYDASFVVDLNSRRGDNENWLVWKYNPSGAPNFSFSDLHEITFNPTSGGYVTADASYASVGQKVKLEVVPNKGSKLLMILVNTTGGTPVAVTEKNGKYEFTMPYGGAVVTAAFQEAYSITTTSSINGSIKSNYKQIYEGETVTLTAVPKQNCRLSSISVQTVTGKEVVVTEKNGKYEFTMPAENVVVNSSFEAANKIAIKKSKNGYIKANHSYAFTGKKVTLTSVPKKKYKLKSIAVKTITGKKVTLKKVNGKYQFIMPKENVIVSAKFKKK